MTFVVRSSSDPMLVAKNLSFNSFNFGMSAHDLRALSLIGLIASCLLICRPCMVVCSIRRIPKYQDLEEMPVRCAPPFDINEMDPQLESI